MAVDGGYYDILATQGLLTYMISPLRDEESRGLRGKETCHMDTELEHLKLEVKDCSFQSTDVFCMRGLTALPGSAE